MKAKVNRVLIYCVGLLILALGITLGTKAGLGVSPIISVAFIVSENTGVDLGNATFVLYSAFVAGEFLLRGRNSRWYDILQLPLSLVFTRFLNIYGHFITYDSANHGLFENLLILALGISLNGLGTCLAMNMRTILNPGEGIVQALIDRTGWRKGFAKNFVDTSCVCATVVIGLVCFGNIKGIHIGTLLAMIFIGRAVALSDRLLKDRICAAAGLKETAP